MSDQKSYFDIVLASLLIIALAPLAALAYPLLVFMIGKPIVFKQQRIGRDGLTFTMYKLRSMNKNAESRREKYKKQNEAPAPMFKIADDPRFLKKRVFGRSFEVGQFLSRSGLDEIPQLLNIFKGEMSFFGPRPLPVDEALKLKKSDPKWFEWRQSVQPGVFSLWAADNNHNKSLEHWKKLERRSLRLSFFEKLEVAWQILLRQFLNIFRKQ